MPKDIHQWFNEYSQSHKNATNKIIHFICVPLIFISLIGLLWQVNLTPQSINGQSLFPYFNLGELLVLGGLIFYLRLSLPIFVGMVFFSIASFLILFLIHTYVSMPLWVVCSGLFVLAWIGQFYGHKIEGKKPSFLTDLKFLLIGPAWILGFVYKKLGIPF
jgi:uncharacterized membrane protein YGL010W